MAIKSMISGAHVILYSRNAEADRQFLRDVLNFPHVDAGHGWLIFALPPSEVAVHPDEADGGHELYLMCADIEALTRTLRERGVECSAPHEERWGVLTHLTLPGGGKLGVYEPRHARPAEPGATRPEKAARRARPSRPRRPRASRPARRDRR
jgi:hypothetical protein